MNMIWARVDSSTGSTVTTFDSGTAGSDATEAAAYLAGKYGSESYQVRITY